MDNHLTYLTDECNDDNKAINSIGDDVWVIIDNATLEERELLFYDFDKIQKAWIQKLTLTQFQFSDNKGALNHTL